VDLGCYRLDVPNECFSLYFSLLPGNFDLREKRGRTAWRPSALSVKGRFWNWRTTFGDDEHWPSLQNSACRSNRMSWSDQQIDCMIFECAALLGSWLVTPAFSPELLECVTRSLAHRGPDDSGTVILRENGTVPKSDSATDASPSLTFLH